MVGDMIHDHTCFLFRNQPRNLADKVLRIFPIHQELCLLNLTQNRTGGPARDHSALGNFAHQIIDGGAAGGAAHTISRSLLRYNCLPLLQLLTGESILQRA